MRRRELNAAAVAAELRVAFVVLGPGLLYLLLRTWYGARPYQPHLENVWATANWQHAATSLIVQFGWLWLPALVGGVLLIQRREWAKALALTVSFGGMALFHILEEPRWIGLARFNLLLLPAVLVLAADGLIPLATRRNLAAPLLLGLVFGQVALSPVDRRGDRAIWGGSGERWYDYSLCLSELRQLKPDGRLATANMSLNYGLMMELQRQDWHTEPLNFSVTNANDALVTLRAALMDAQKARIDFVIFRWDGTPEVPRDFQHGSYVRWRDYPSPGGTLTAFVRIDSVPLPATPAQSKP